MHFSRTDTHLQQATSKAAANNGAGRAGISMPAVPALQQKPVQKKEDEQQEPPEFETKPLQLRKDVSDSGVIQREVENRKLDDKESVLGKKAEEFFQSVNTKAQEAHMFAMTIPSLGAYAELDGYTKLWKEKWDFYLAGGAPPLMAATFGYVVESLVSNKLGPYRPTPPSGCTISYQVTVGGTRPDLVLRASGVSEDVAWVDLTANGSVDHIFNKDSWDTKVARYAEVSYPSLDPGSLAFMRKNKDNTGALSREDFLAAKEAERKAYALKKAQWKNYGEKYKFGNYPMDIDSSTLKLIPSLKQETITGALRRDFNDSSLDPKLVPSILIAMGVNPAPWGFNLGTSQSEKAGDAWLTDHDPTLPEEAKSSKDKEEKKKDSEMEVEEL